jgi:uncharacterized protein (UPF0248 family)
VHRGAPGDERTVSGADVVDVASWYFELASEEPVPAMIPYHRVLRIALDDGELVWERRARD